MRVTIDLTDSEYGQLKSYADAEEFGNKTAVIRKAIRAFFSPDNKKKQETVPAGSVKGACNARV